MEDVGRAFTYMFQDERWVTKILIGGGFVILSAIIGGIWGVIISPFGGTAANAVLAILTNLVSLAASAFYIGYAVETLQNVADGRELPLPEWTDIGRKFYLGVILGIVLFVYQLPASILGALAGGIGAFGLAGAAAGGALGCVALLVLLFVSFITPAIVISFAQSPTFAGGFNFPRIFEIIGASLGWYLVVILLTIVAFIISIFGLIGLVIGVFFTIFWAFLVTANLLGRLARHTAGKARA